MKILVFVALGVFILEIIIAYPHVNRFYQAKRFEKSGDMHFSQKEYTEALTNFQAANVNRSSDRLLEKIRKSNILKVSEENYQLGKSAFENKEYKQAIKYFTVVDKHSPQYSYASKYIAQATTLESQTQSLVLGDSTERLNKQETTQISVKITPTPSKSSESASSTTSDLYKDNMSCPQHYFDCSSKCSDAYLAQLRENDAIRERMADVDPLRVDDFTRQNSSYAEKNLKSCEKTCCNTWIGAGYKGCAMFCFESNAFNTDSTIDDFSSTLKTNDAERKAREAERKAEEAERKADEAEGCQRSTQIYSDCIENYNKKMEEYAECNSKKNEEMEKYASCVDEYNNDLEDYNSCVENPFDLRFNYCSKPSKFCFESSASCWEPRNSCTKPFLPFCDNHL